MSTTLPASKKLKGKNIGDDCNDELGNLPEAVLNHILSLLPTKDAVLTSLLSRKWRGTKHISTWILAGMRRDARRMKINCPLDDLPKLHNLIQLTVTDGEFIENLMALLHRAQVVEYLTFAKNADVHGKVPQYIVSHLKVVEFQHYNGMYWLGETNDWLDFARFLLNNATALEKMINFRGYLTTKKMEQLLEFPRCSTRASIVFTK